MSFNSSLQCVPNKFIDQILDLYYDIKSKSINDQNLFVKNERDKMRDMNLKTIINYIKESINILVQLKCEESLNRFNTELKGKFTANEADMIEQQDEYEKIICKLESEIRNHIKIQFQMKLHNESIEFKVQYLECELVDYEELQKNFEDYENKVFANDYSHATDKKENEILILKSENSNLKNIVSNLELKIKNSNINNKGRLEEIKKQYENELNKNSEIIEKLNKKIRVYAKMLKNYTMDNNCGVISNSNNTINCKINGGVSNLSINKENKESIPFKGIIHSKKLRDQKDEDTNFNAINVINNYNTNNIKKNTPNRNPNSISNSNSIIEKEKNFVDVKSEFSNNNDQNIQNSETKPKKYRQQSCNSEELSKHLNAIKNINKSPTLQKIGDTNKNIFINYSKRLSSGSVKNRSTNYNIEKQQIVSPNFKGTQGLTGNSSSTTNANSNLNTGNTSSNFNFKKASNNIPSSNCRENNSLINSKSNTKSTNLENKNSINSSILRNYVYHNAINNNKSFNTINKNKKSNPNMTTMHLRSSSITNQ